MKKMTQIFFLIAISFIGWSAPSIAQDNNMLAKIAYESAEEALAAGNVSETFKELNKVDSLLKKLTPKSMYLRVQLFILATKENPENVENAIKICNEYLGLSKSFNLPEDKVMEVTKLRIKLEKQKAEWDLKNKEEEKAVARVKFVLDSIYSLCNFKVGMTEDDVFKANPEFVKQMKTKTEVSGKWHTNNNGNEGYVGPTTVLVKKGGLVSLYAYRYKTAGKKDAYETESEFTYKWKPLLESVFPKEVFEINGPNYVRLYFHLGGIAHLLHFELGEFRKAKTIEISIQSTLIN